MASTKWFTPFEDLKIAEMVASEDTLVVAGATDDAEVEVRSARWDGERFVDFRRIAVPHATDLGPIQPSLSLDRHNGRLALAIDLGDEQLDSRGFFVVPDLALAECETIPRNERDSEMDFSESLLLRGDTLLTRGPWDLRCFDRQGGKWIRRLLLATGDSHIEWSPPIDLSPSGNTWMTGRSGDGAQLVVLERRADLFAPGFELAMEHQAISIAFIDDDEALVGSAVPWSDGASLRSVRRVDGGWKWGRTYEVAPEPTGIAVTQVVVCRERAVITQRDAAWLMDLAEAISVPIRLPPVQPGYRPDPQVRIMGTHAVLRVEDQIRLMDLGG